MASYYEVIEQLERKIAQGTASYSEKQMAERLGVPMNPTRVAFKDLGYTHVAIKAGSVDPGKLNTLINTLRGLGISMTGAAFVPSATSEQKLEGVVRLLSDWLEQPGMAAQGTGGTGVTKINDKTVGNSGGAGASSRIRPGGSAGANPKPNPAAQKSYNDPYLESAQMLTRGFFRPGPNRTPTR